MKRRKFITLLGGAVAWPLAARAQQPKLPVTSQNTGRVHRVGVLFAGSGRGSVPDEAFRSGLRERGYIEGKNIVIEFRNAAGKYDDLSGLATELVESKVDIIFAPAEAALRASLQASRVVPIVIAAIEYDPVEVGIVTSIARPGGNVTGVIFSQLETSSKRVELLKDVVPGLTSVAALIESGGKFQLHETERAARSLGISFRIIELSAPPDFDRAFETALNERVGAIVVLVSPVTYAQRAMIASLAIKNRLPAIAPFSEFAESGGLLSYGASFATMFHYAAYYVDRILKGASPGDLPMEQPTKFELCINLKTAKALGLTVPDKLLVAADKVIE
jgi:putative tryptophan/tyrosine transport system substrate-binding protein